MNSKERHELRYRRRKARREEKKRSLAEQYGDFDKVFTFENLYAAYKGCCKGVGWKASTQRYKANVLLNVVDTLDLLKSGKFKSKGFYEFDIIERGKERHIKSVHISERVVQRCLCDYSLVPIFSNSFIYDNGACMKDKGIDFAVNRLKVIVIPARKGIVKERRKLKKLKIKFDAGEREFFDIKQSYNSWRGHIKHCNAKRTLKRMDRLFYELFYKETSMEEPVITIENICQACEKGPCEQPCELWYKCLEGTIIKPEDLE